MEEIKRLALECKNISLLNDFSYNHIYNEIIDLIIDSKMSNNKKIIYLKELYNYIYYNSNIKTNYMGCLYFKSSILFDIRRNLLNGKDSDLLIEIKKINIFLSILCIENNKSNTETNNPNKTYTKNRF